MRKRVKELQAALFGALLLALPLHAAEIQVFAAASLADALTEIAAGYEKGLGSGDVVRFNFAGSNILARQIMEGAPADVFVSADEAKMDGLEKEGRLLEGTRRSLLSNTLAVIVRVDSALKLDSPHALAGSAEIKRLALADTRAVPAGVYAKAYLEKVGAWEALKDRVVPVENVRAALAAVEAGNAGAGIVYKTDAAISKTVKIAFEAPVADAPEISYPAAVVKDSKNPEPARKFLNHLESAPASAVFRKFGFLLITTEE